LIIAVVVALAACTRDAPSDPPVQLADPGSCTPVDVVAAPEVAPVVDELAQSFNDSPAARLSAEECAFVRLQTVDASLAARNFVGRWPDPQDLGPAPALWVTPSSAGAALVNQRLEENKRPRLFGAGTSLGRSKLVVAMPTPMAKALGWPAKKIGWQTLAGLAQGRRGWAALGHPEWGAFRLGKASPERATSGLLATIALDRLGNDQAARALESSVVYYGDSPWTYLDNWQRLDRQRHSLSYLSAAITDARAVEAYNAGSANGTVPKDRDLPRPHTTLTGIVPADGSYELDFPMVVPDASWVEPAARRGAKAFVEYTRGAEAVQKVEAAGLRPATSAAKRVGFPDVADALDHWTDIRKPGRVLILFDVSDSMGDVSDHRDPDSPRKIVLAKRALLAALDELAPNDQVGLRIFTTDLPNTASPNWADVVPIRRVDKQRRALSRAVSSLAPRNGSPLYAATRDAYDTMAEDFDRDRINAVVLLTDSYNEDDANDDRRALLAHLREPVRIFPIAYSPEADLSSLRRIAQATNATAYDATDTQRIDETVSAAFANF
jgi:Ca-activated chloride channel family protein